MVRIYINILKIIIRLVVRLVFSSFKLKVTSQKLTTFTLVSLLMFNLNLVLNISVTALLICSANWVCLYFQNMLDHHSCTSRSYYDDIFLCNICKICSTSNSHIPTPSKTAIMTSKSWPLFFSPIYLCN